MNPFQWDERRHLLIPGDEIATLDACAHHFVSICKKAIATYGSCYVALSGGKTPKSIFQRITSPPYAEQIDWSCMWLFWSDERSVPPDDPESNYKMAMDAGFAKMSIPPSQIIRMEAEREIEKHALDYELQIKKNLNERPFDLIMLGMGEDGHTASLFPHTDGLKIKNRIVISNYISDKKTWRMTLTFDAINRCDAIVIYLIGPGKKEVFADLFQGKPQAADYPIDRVGTEKHPALWIVDRAAAATLISRLKSEEYSIIKKFNL